MTQYWSILRRLRQDSRGNGVIETAVILPVLTYMALGFVDLTVGFTEKLKLQQYAQTGGELVASNIAKVPTDSEIKTHLAAASGLNPSAITITRWLECNGNQEANHPECANPASVKARFLEIEVTDTYVPVLGSIGPYAYIGSSQLVGTIAIRIE